MPTDLIHLVDSPFRSKRARYFTVFGTGRIFDLLVSRRFYPTLLPVNGNLISLTVTTENLENRFDYLQTSYNKIITANLSPTSEQDNFVTHGRFSIYDVSDEVYEVYLESLNFNIISVPPTIIEKEIDGKKHIEIIGRSRHFRWTNYSYYGKESIDATFNIIFVNFPKENIRYPKHTTIKFKGQELNTISVVGRMLVLGYDGSFSFVFINLLFDHSLYDEISKNELLTCVLQVYTLYNLKEGNKDSQPINLVTAVIPFFGSFEEIIPFCCNSFSIEGLHRKCIIEKKRLDRLRSQALEGTPESTRDIHTESRISILREHSDYYEFSILRTDSVLKFIREAISSDYGKRLLESTLSSEKVQEKMQELVSQLRKSSFIDGALVSPSVRKAIMDSFQN